MVGPASPRFPATIGSLLSTPYDHNLSVKEMVKLFPSTTEEEARMLIDQADELEVSKPSSDTLNGNEKCAEQTNLRQSITKALNAAHDQILGKEWYPGLGVVGPCYEAGPMLYQRVREGAPRGAQKRLMTAYAPSQGERIAVLLVDRNLPEDQLEVLEHCLKNEEDILNQLHAGNVPHIPQLYGRVDVLTAKPPFSALFMEHCGDSDVMTAIQTISAYETMTDKKSRDSFTPQWEKLAKRVARCALETLHGAHLRGIIHRDMKPENLVLAPDGEGVYTIDWAFGTKTGKIGFTGTRNYMAPELVLCPEDCTSTANDIWSLGATLVATRYKNWVIGDLTKLEPETLKQKVESWKTEWEKNPTACYQRISSTTPIQLTHFDAMVMQMLDPDPSKRGSAWHHLLFLDEHMNDLFHSTYEPPTTSEPLTFAFAPEDSSSDDELNLSSDDQNSGCTIA